MSGSASVISEDQILLRSIDYVGLQKLTGAWRNDTEIFRFYDFRNFSYWNFDRVTQKYRGPFDYHYALSPYGEVSPRCLFKMFILDNFGVTLGSLEWAAEDQVHLQIYDPDTGEVSSTKHLIRGVL